LDFEFRQLRFALAAAEHGSFRAGAEALDVESSSLSRQIQRIEARLGMPLFHRSRQGVTPTAAGEQFLHSARRILRESERMVASTRRAREQAGDRLTIGFYTALNAGYLKATLVEFARRYPRVTIDAAEAPRAALFDEIAAERIDVAIVTGDRSEPDLASMPLWSERVFLATPAGHPLAANPRAAWTDLGGSRVLLSARDPGPDLAQLMAERLRYAAARPTIATYRVSCEHVRALAAAGFGIALVPEACLGARHDGLAYQPLHGEEGPSRLGYAAHWAEDNSNPALAHFLQLLRERHPNGDAGPVRA
jgi:DNA-binding transcriptional LysR family regulator